MGHAVAGAVGACVSNVCTYPLAFIVTRLQAQQRNQDEKSTQGENRHHSLLEAIRELHASSEGFGGFFVGLWPDTLKTIGDSFLFFLAYDFLRRSRLRKASGQLSASQELQIGVVAGAFAKFFTTPLANIVTRRQTSGFSLHGDAKSGKGRATLFSIASNIKSETGLLGFWSGYSASLILTINPSLTFFFYETFKWAVIPPSRRSGPNSKETFLLAAVSKALASSITYPISLAKTRLQASRYENDRTSTEPKVESSTSSGREAARASLLSTIIAIIRTEGPSALYDGLEAEILKGFFSHGITMLVKESIHKLVIKMFYLSLKILKRWPSPEQMADMAKQRAARIATKTG